MAEAVANISEREAGVVLQFENGPGQLSLRIRSFVFHISSVDVMRDGATEFMQDCAARIRGRVQITTDAHHAYLNAVEDAFGTGKFIALAGAWLLLGIRWSIGTVSGGFYRIRLFLQNVCVNFD